MHRFLSIKLDFRNTLKILMFLLPYITVMFFCLFFPQLLSLKAYVGHFVMWCERLNYT